MFTAILLVVPGFPCRAAARVVMRIVSHPLLFADALPLQPVPAGILSTVKKAATIGLSGLERLAIVSWTGESNDRRKRHAKREKGLL